MAETKREKFIRVGERRINEVLDGLRLLANLKSGGYDSTQDMRNEMTGAIRSALDELEGIWAGCKPDKERFHFKSRE